MAKQAVDWLAEKLDHIRGLKQPTEAQRLLALLAEKPDRTKDDDAKLAAIIRAEKSVERAARAKSEVNNLLAAEAKKIRAARTHQLCRSAGLMGLAGLIDHKTGHPLRDPAELLGALLELAAIDPTDDTRRRWRDLGVDAMTRRGGELDDDD